MKNFDEVRAKRAETDRSFVIGGETFVRKPAVAPEEILQWNRATGGEVELSEAEWIDTYDETILVLLEPGQEEKWREVRRRDVENPLTIGDLSGLIRWLFEEMSGRPTTPSSDSSDGRPSTETTSKGDSSSTPAAT